MSPNTATSDQPSQWPHSSGMTAAVTAKGRTTAAMFTRRSSEVMPCRLASTRGVATVPVQDIPGPLLEAGDSRRHHWRAPGSNRTLVRLRDVTGDTRREHLFDASRCWLAGGCVDPVRRHFNRDTDEPDRGAVLVGDHGFAHVGEE